MANWATTTFFTTDQEIADIIQNGQTMDFVYDNELGRGTCDLRWGLRAIDTDKIARIVEDRKEDFYIIAYDMLGCFEQEWKFKDGILMLYAVRRKEPEFVPVDDEEFDLIMGKIRNSNEGGVEDCCDDEWDDDDDDDDSWFD